MNPGRDVLLENKKFSVGEDVQLLRGKHKNSIVRVVYVDVYTTYAWTGQGYGRTSYLGYTCRVGDEDRRYREGSLAVFDLTEEALSEALTSLMATYEELVVDSSS